MKETLINTTLDAHSHTDGDTATESSLEKYNCLSVDCVKMMESTKGATSHPEVTNRQICITDKPTLIFSV